MINAIAFAFAAFTIGTVTASDVYPDPTAADTTFVSVRLQPCVSGQGKCWAKFVNTCVKSKIEGVPQKCSVGAAKELDADTALKITTP